MKENKNNHWNYDLLSSIPELTKEQIEEKWNELKDSEDPSKLDELSGLFARIVFQEIRYVSNKYGFDEKFVFSNYDLEMFLRDKYSRDLDRPFFWSDLYEQVRDSSRGMHEKMRNGKWISRVLYETVRDQITLHMKINNSAEEIIKDVSSLYRDAIDPETIRLIYEEIEKVRAYKMSEQQLREGFFKCSPFERYTESVKEYYFDKLMNLNGSRRLILIAYFGIQDGKVKQFGEVANEFHVSRTLVVQTVKDFLRKPLIRRKRLIDYLDD